MSDREPDQQAQVLPTTVAELQMLLTAERQRLEEATQRITALEQEREHLRASYERLLQEVKLWKRRLFIANAERAENLHQLRLEFEAKLRELDAAAGTLGMPPNALRYQRGRAAERKARQGRETSRQTRKQSRPWKARFARPAAARRTH